MYDRPGKPLLFSPDERIELFRTALRDTPNTEVVGYHGLTVEFASQRAARFIIRGLRVTTDFEYETQLFGMNRHLRPDIETVFLLTAPQHRFLSSSLVKEVAAQGAELAGLVPTEVADALTSRLGRES